MNKIKTQRKLLSLLLMLTSLLALGGIFATSFQNLEYSYILGIHIAIIVLVVSIYFSIRKMYKETKLLISTITEYQNPENVTIEQVMNIEDTENQTIVHQNEDKFNHLIEQFSKFTNPVDFANSFLTRMAKEFEIVQGLFYKFDAESNNFEPIADYAFYGEEKPQPFRLGEGLSGQAARDKKMIYLTDLPLNYRKVVSGLGNREPKNLALIPIVHDDKVVALVELAFFKPLESAPLAMLEKILNNLSNHFEK